MEKTNLELWKKYDDNMSLYKYYFDLSIKIIMWYSSIVGAIFAFFVANQSLNFITYILLIPIFLSIFLTALTVSAISLLNVIEEDFIELSQKLNMDSYPTITPLIWIMYCCCFIFCLIAIGLIIISIFNFIYF